MSPFHNLRIDELPAHPVGDGFGFRGGAQSNEDLKYERAYSSRLRATIGAAIVELIRGEDRKALNTLRSVYGFEFDTGRLAAE